MAGTVAGTGREERREKKRENLRRNGARKREGERKREKGATVAREAAPSEQKPCKPVWAVSEPVPSQAPVSWCGRSQREQTVVGLPLAMPEAYSPHLGGRSGALQAWQMTAFLGLGEKDCFRENWGTHSTTKKPFRLKSDRAGFQILLQPGAKTIQVGKPVFSVNGAPKTGYLHAKE